jgi:hypothetical protein
MVGLVASGLDPALAWSFRGAPKAANPESIALGRWLWIPGSPLHAIRISKSINWSA